LLVATRVSCNYRSSGLELHVKEWFVAIDWDLHWDSSTSFAIYITDHFGWPFRTGSVPQPESMGWRPSISRRGASRPKDEASNEVDLGGAGRWVIKVQGLV